MFFPAKYNNLNETCLILITKSIFLRPTSVQNISTVQIETWFKLSFKVATNDEVQAFLCYYRACKNSYTFIYHMGKEMWFTATLTWTLRVPQADHNSRCAFESYGTIKISYYIIKKKKFCWYNIRGFGRYCVTKWIIFHNTEESLLFVMNFLHLSFGSKLNTKVFQDWLHASIANARIYLMGVTVCAQAS